MADRTRRSAGIEPKQPAAATPRSSQPQMRHTRSDMTVDVASLAGDFLREARKSHGLTQGELAERVGTHQPQISAWERGLRSVTVTQLVQLLDALDLELHLEARPRTATTSGHRDPGRLRHERQRPSGLP